jgi:Repeat of unknown function (DUF5650)
VACLHVSQPDSFMKGYGMRMSRFSLQLVPQRFRVHDGVWQHPEQHWFHRWFALFVVFGALMIPTKHMNAASEDLLGPIGSGSFGQHIAVLSNGNIVVTDPDYSAESTLAVGAVYLYNGSTRELISTLVGSQPNDRVGSGGVITLSNGNYVVISLSWANGSATNAGAVTWGNSTTGVSGVVSASNSLIGSAINDRVGSDGITLLSTGNYLVHSLNWDNGIIPDTGAVTWSNGETGSHGVINGNNSLIGSQPQDGVGNLGITVLSNGNYVVSSGNWDNGNDMDAGAATWGDGKNGSVGSILAARSALGTVANGGQRFTDGQFNAVSNVIVVGIPAENRVAFIRLPVDIYLPIIMAPS